MWYSLSLQFRKIKFTCIAIAQKFPYISQHTETMVALIEFVYMQKHMDAHVPSEMVKYLCLLHLATAH